MASSPRTDQGFEYQGLYYVLIFFRPSLLLSDSVSLDSIFLSISPRPTLFASFKYVGNAFDEDMARMAANPKVQEWWRMTDGMQESPVEGAIGSKDGPGWWGQTEEVFYLE